ncbi:unnamed protein product [Pseudo-nitzschia multistriata]|uniref:Nucleotide-diphospho-sugar transferase domain-containing protein n=1 Tax=Pseudo-nitzschia multistriata TaxID=183589 RepID=A0A448ZDK4_9STRA|nr:unnamed protein product [Pseudo-nitzschia multistriata]
MVGARATMMRSSMTTRRLVTLFILSSILVSLRHAGMFYTRQLGNVDDGYYSDYSNGEERPQISVITLDGLTEPPDWNNTTAKSTSGSGNRHTATIDSRSEKNHISGNTTDIDKDFEKRAIVLISMGQKAENMSMVERFVWSARNIGKYKGWIILITDASYDRYADLKAAVIPSEERGQEMDGLQNNPTTLSPSLAMKGEGDNLDADMMVTTKEDSDQNAMENKFLVFRPKEKRFAKITKHGRFTQSKSMNSKIFKTYILQYAKKEPLLDSVELFYYLDVDIVFGNNISPLFKGLEGIYDFGLHTTSSEYNQSTNAQIHFFEGNGSQEIQGGQIVLNRYRSQPCLERWRELMQATRRERYLKDQLSLTVMLDEQRARNSKNASAASNHNHSAIIGGTPSTSQSHIGASTDDKDKKKKKKKGPRPECDIVLMKKHPDWISFPELSDIRERSAQLLNATTTNTTATTSTYPTLLHFRNSAHVMKDVEEEHLERYMRDILGFSQHQADDLGIFRKMVMDKGKKN